MVETVRKLVQRTWNIPVDLVDKAPLGVGEILAGSAVSEQVKQTGLTHLNGNVQEVLVLLIIEIANDVGMQITLLEELDFLFGQPKVLGQHAFDGHVAVLGRCSDRLATVRDIFTYVPFALKNKGTSTSITQKFVLINGKLSDPLDV